MTVALQQDDLLSQSVGTSAPSTIFQSNGNEFKSKFTRPFWNTPNDSTDRSSTNNEAWVTWKDPEDGETFFDTVTGLSSNTVVYKLCEDFVKQQYLQNVDPADVKVRETENGQVLRAGTPIKQYIVPPECRGEGPGQSKKTALFLTLPNTSMQQPQLQVSHSTVWN